jgi:hypothetical protein
MDLSYLLPKLDVGYTILHADHKFIVNLFSSEDNIPHDVKKKLVLFTIKMAQYGDSVGSELFQKYYELVDKLI